MSFLAGCVINGRLRQPIGASAQVLSIIIPTLHAADELAQTLDHLNGAGVAGEFIVADGGSVDATPVIAAAAGVKFTAETGGRGPQLAAGDGDRELAVVPARRHPPTAGVAPRRQRLHG